MKLFKRITFSDWILFASLILVGGFHEYIGCILAAVLSGYLIYRLVQYKQISVRWDLTTLAIVLVVGFYAFSCLWAVDRGMALLGFFKFLPILLYALCLWQEQGSGQALRLLPGFTAVITVISAVCMHLPVLKEFFNVAGRLAGFFQYPNAFALLILVCILLLIKKEKRYIYDYVILLILIAGLLYTGSRTVFVLALISVFAMLLCTGGKKLRIAIICVVGLSVLTAIVLLLGQGSVLERYLNISLTESTFVGRLLYYVDALPLLLKYPFGMGYMGYYYIQSSIQTGVYSVAYIHNDFLQILLDVGLIPGLLFIVAIIVWLFNKKYPISDKLIVATICAHSFFDFDLQFLSVFFVLILLLNQHECKTVSLKSARAVLTGSLAVVTVVAVYLGTAAGLSHFKFYKAADVMYPYNTRNTLSILAETEDVNVANQLADQILGYNTTCYVPYSIKAKYHYTKGNFTAMMENKKIVFEKSPFSYEEYEEYCVMLINGISLYQQAGDPYSMQVCLSQLKGVPGRLKMNENRLSTLGKMIIDQPVTELPEEIMKYISAIEQP